MTPITIETKIDAPLEKVWTYFTEPSHVTEWNHASDDWHSPRAANDLRPGGEFNFRMESKDGSEGFDFAGTYDDVILYEQIRYTMGDGRKVNVTFEDHGDGVVVSETFDPESENPIEMQREGWQAILDNFKTYAESH